MLNCMKVANVRIYHRVTGPERTKDMDLNLERIIFIHVLNMQRDSDSYHSYIMHGKYHQCGLLTGKVPVASCSPLITSATASRDPRFQSQHSTDHHFLSNSG